MDTDDDNPRAWMLAAKCRGQDPAPWDCKRSSHGSAASANYAKQLCEHCPVWRECAEDALRSDDVGVIRAGRILTLSRKQNKRVLELVLHTGMGDARAVHVSQRQVDIWKDTKCVGCGSALRPQGAPMEVWPDTKSAVNKHICTGCYNSKGNMRVRARWADRTCRTCDVHLRPRGAVEYDWPNTIEIYARNICKKCFRAERARREGRGGPGGRMTLEQLKRAWAECCCSICKKNMRPPAQTSNDWPGTIQGHSKEVCRTCYQRERYRKKKKTVRRYARRAA